MLWGRNGDGVFRSADPRQDQHGALLDNLPKLPNGVNPAQLDLLVAQVSEALTCPQDGNMVLRWLVERFENNNVADGAWKMGSPRASRPPAALDGVAIVADEPVGTWRWERSELMAGIVPTGALF